jgi:hypothetical protein
MARRSNIRFPIRINVKFSCSDKVHSGLVTDISEKGMFIKTKDMCYPEDRQFNLAIPLENEMAHLPVKINRLINMKGGNFGIGVELLNPPPQYIEYVENLLLLM